MNKENKCAASLRRSAVVERIRLREEWSALKGATNDTEKTLKQNIKKSRRNVNINTALSPQKNTLNSNRVYRSDKQINDVLRGIVVLVEVGSESRALALRAALSALGASVVPIWSPLVTHLVWTQGGCRSVRAKARALACQLVSPLWVEACAAEGRKLPERIFPAPSRPSDLPSPATLRRLLKKAEHENIPLPQLLGDSQGDDVRPTRLRLSSETEKDTTNTDTSRDVSKDTSRDSPDIQIRVNTAPRRPPQTPMNPQKPTKSKRKLFTQKEPGLQTTDDENDNEPVVVEPKKSQKFKITLSKDLAQAERLAKRLMGTTKNTHACTEPKKTMLGTQFNKAPRIVLTGMTRTERQYAWRAIRELNGKVQNHVDKKTTHVIMGSCHELNPTNPISRESPKINPNKSPETKERNLSICSQCNSPGRILTLMFENNVTVKTNVKNNIKDKIICKCKNNDISGVNYLSNDAQSKKHSRVNARTQSNDALTSVNENANINNVSDKIPSARRKTSSFALRRNIPSNDGKGKNTSNDNGTECVIENAQSSDIFGSENVQSNSDNGTDSTQSNLLSPCRGNTENSLSFKNNGQGNDVLHDSVENIQSNDICPVTDNNVVGTLGSVAKKIKPRTVNALLGAARGCRVLGFEWVKDSSKANRWLQHIGYEVPHLKKMSQKARAERSALNKINSDYAHNVFNGMRVRISPDAEQKDAVTQFLTLCGAVIQNDNPGVIQNDNPFSVINVQNATKQYKPRNGVKITFSDLLTRIERNQNGGLNNSKLISDVRYKHGRRFGATTQDGGAVTAGVDLTIGRGNGEVSSKWVFDSVAAARMRTTRRYINNN